MSKYLKPSYKATFPNRDSYKEHDFLRGDGSPSGQEHCDDPLEKKGAFRSGWQRKKHIVGEKDAERAEKESQRAERAQATATIRRDHIEQRQLRNAFNPITGQEYNGPAKSWQPASDPWSHHRPCVKPQPAIARHIASSEQGAGSLRPQGAAEDRAAACQKVMMMRRERLASDGLPPIKRETATMKDILQWS